VVVVGLSYNSEFRHEVSAVFFFACLVSTGEHCSPVDSVFYDAQQAISPALFLTESRLTRLLKVPPVPPDILIKYTKLRGRWFPATYANFRSPQRISGRTGSREKILSITILHSPIFQSS